MGGNLGCGDISVEGRIWMASHTGEVRGEGVLGVIFRWQAIQVDSKEPMCESLLFTQSTLRPPAPSAPSSGRTPGALGDDMKVVAWNHHGDILHSLVETEDRVGKLEVSKVSFSEGPDSKRNGKVSQWGQIHRGMARKSAALPLAHLMFPSVSVFSPTALPLSYRGGVV